MELNKKTVKALKEEIRQLIISDDYDKQKISKRDLESIEIADDSNIVELLAISSLCISSIFSLNCLSTDIDYKPEHCVANCVKCITYYLSLTDEEIAANK